MGNRLKGITIRTIGRKEQGESGGGWEDDISSIPIRWSWINLAECSAAVCARLIDEHTLSTTSSA